MNACQFTVSATNLNGAKNFNRNRTKIDSILKLGHQINIFVDTRFKMYQKKLLNKLFPQFIVTSCNPRANARGVACFVDPHLDFVYIDCEIDDQGNLLSLHCQILGTEVVLIGFYGLSTDNIFFYQRLADMAKRAYQSCSRVMIMGDFNLFF